MKETITTQCYPSDDKINEMVSMYQNFGWELVSNQRCQEYTGQTSGSDGSTTNHYSTFNKLTFSREKSSPWYKEVVQLEKRYVEVNEELSTLYRREPKVSWYTKPVNIFIAGSLALLYIFPGVLYVIYRKIRNKAGKKTYQKKHEEWVTNNQEKIQSLAKEKDDILQKDDQLING